MMSTPTASRTAADPAFPADSAATSGTSLQSWLRWWRWISFALGCALLVGCAWALSSRLQQWSHDYGSMLVFLVFFLIMSIAGRWFWAGIDAALGVVIRGSSR